MFPLRRPLFFVVLLFATVLFGPVAGAAPLSVDSIPESDEYFLRTWEIDDGLPNNTVTGIAQTQDGYLWLSTLGGVARFDGVRFTLYQMNASLDHGANRLRAIFVSRDNNLWIGLELGGVARWAGDHFEPVYTDKSDFWPHSFAEDADGAVWFGFYTPDKVSRWKDGKVTDFTHKDGISKGPHTQVCAETDGKIWYANAGGCGFFDGTRFQSVDSKGEKWVRLARARDGGMWAQRGPGLLRYRTDGTKEMVLDLTGLAVEILFEDSSGNLWIGTRNAGLLRYRDGKLVRVPVSDSSVLSIFEDREGNLWIGTQGGGLDRLRSRHFFLRQTKHGLQMDDIYSLCKDTGGRLWLAGREASLVRAMDPDNQTFAVPPDWNPTPVMSVCADPEGGIWLGTLRGLMHWRAGVFEIESFREGVTSLLKDRHGHLWLGTIGDGLVCWQNGVAKPVAKQDGVIHPRALAEDAAGRLWVGTEEGLVFQYRGDFPVSGPPAAYPLTGTGVMENGFIRVPLLEETPMAQIRFIVPDEKDTVWIGVANDGLYRWREGRIMRLPGDSGMSLNDIRSLAISNSGDFWIGTGHGLLLMTRSEIDAVMDGRRQPPVHSILFGRNDGLPNVEFEFGFRNTTTVTGDGHIWFATTRGALEIIPQKSRKSPSPSPVLIEEIEADGTLLPTSIRTGFTLPPRPGLLQIRYTLPQLSTPGQVQFRYRLISGREDKWVYAGEQRVASFTHLPPGDYHFEVAAAESGGSWLSATASVDFTVGAAWWETVWFKMGSWLAGAFVLTVIVRFVVKRRMRARIERLEQATAVERERARLARDLHDDLGASLTQIALFAGLAESESGAGTQAGENANRAATCAHQAVTALDEIVWAVNPGNDTLQSLLEYTGQRAVDYLHGSGIRCLLDLPVDPPSIVISSDFRHHIFLIVQEALQNAVKHAAADEIRLKIAILDGWIALEIADNGCGFVMGERSAGSDGLANMKSRAEELGGKCQIDSGQGRGTTLRFDLPLRRGKNIIPGKSPPD